MKILFVYSVSISIFAIVICCYDKVAAKTAKRRISERTLILISLLGGSVAMYVTMRIIHHKTLHNKFMVGLPVIILLQTAIMLLLKYGDF